MPPAIDRGVGAVRDAGDARLDDLRGPTGNFRAPILKVGRRLLVGFHEETNAVLVSATRNKWAELRNLLEPLSASARLPASRSFQLRMVLKPRK